MTSGNGVPDTEHIVALLDRATDRMRDEVAARIDWTTKGGLRPWHLAILLILPERGARPSALADRAGISRQAVSQWIRELSADGYLVIATDRGDRRGRVVRPTAKAHRTVEEAQRAIAHVEEAWARELGGDRLEELRTALRDLRDRAAG